MLQPGTTLDNGKYRIEAAIGRGGFGHVYRAHEELTGETVAIKELVPGLVTDPQMVQRFIQEARATLRLTHPHIARTHTIFRDGDTYYLSMEYLPGGSLTDRLRQGPLPVNEALRIATELCGALDYAHSQGVVHCDLKPGNVLFDARGDVRLADFGIAYVSEQMMTRHVHTGTGAVMGTVRYMAPEQLEGVRADPRIDVYALGTLLYEMLAGRPYLDFETETTPAAQMRNLQRIQTSPPRPLRDANPAVPEGLARVIGRTLQKQPHQRFASVAALGEALAKQVPSAVPSVALRAAPAPLKLVLPGGREIALAAGTLTLGREPACDVMLSDQQVSRRHAALQITSSGVSVVDLGSTNGSFVNGERLEAQQPRLLRAGDALRLGTALTLRVEAGSVGGPPPVPPPRSPGPPSPTRIDQPGESVRRKGLPRWLLLLLVALAVLSVACLVVMALLVLGGGGEEPIATPGTGTADVTALAATTTPSATSSPTSTAAMLLTTTATLAAASPTPAMTSTSAPATASPTPVPATLTSTPAPPTPTATATDQPAPAIAFFQVSPASIVAGDCTTLEWGAVSHADQAVIDQGIGGVGTPGSRTVCPGGSTTYVLTATGPGGTTTASATVSVAPAVPDLIIESVVFVPSPPVQNQDNQVRITIRNIGTGAAGPFSWEWQPGSYQTYPSGFVGGGLPAGNVIEVSGTWHPASWYGNLSTVARVDVGNAVAESNEANNERQVNIQVVKP